MLRNFEERIEKMIGDVPEFFFGDQKFHNLDEAAVAAAEYAIVNLSTETVFVNTSTGPKPCYRVDGVQAREDMCNVVFSQE